MPFDFAAALSFGKTFTLVAGHHFRFKVFSVLYFPFFLVRMVGQGAGLEAVLLGAVWHQQANDVKSHGKSQRESCPARILPRRSRHRCRCH